MFLKIQHSILKLNNLNFNNIIIDKNNIIDKDSKEIIKTIEELDFDNNVYNLELNEDKIFETIEIYIIINLNTCCQLIQLGTVIPNREFFFKLLNVYHLSNSKCHTNNFIILKEFSEIINESVKLYPHHIISLDGYIFDLKYHRILTDYYYKTFNLNGGIININSHLCVLQILKNNNNGRKLFILNSNDIEIFYKISESFNDNRKNLILKEINDETTFDYNIIFVTISTLRKYYMHILKEYISSSKDIDFNNSLENMLSDHNISNGNNNKFFSVSWDTIFIENSCINTKRATDIVEHLNTKEKWILFDNKFYLDKNIKSILNILLPVKKFNEDFLSLQENMIYYKSINELPFLKMKGNDNKIIYSKQYILQKRLFKFDNSELIKKIDINYNKQNISYYVENYTKELFILCDKYNFLDIFIFKSI